MTTVIGNQVKAFGDSVMEAHHHAMHACGIEDILKSGPSIVRMVADILDRSHASEVPTLASEVQAPLRKLLEALSIGKELASTLQKQGYTIDALAEFEDAIVDTRELLASMIDAAASARSAPPSNDDHRDEFVAAASLYPPPQSWHEEDVSKLRGPVID